MTLKELAHSAHQHLQIHAGCAIKRSHVHELLAAAFGCQSWASFLSESLLADGGAGDAPVDALPHVIGRAAQLGYGQSVSVEMGNALIRSFGKGTFHKPPLSGSDVGTKRLYRIEPGDLLFSNVFAWEGAIAIAQPEDEGRLGSHRFITCQVNPDQTTAEFLRYFFLTEDGMLKIGEASPGGAGRNRTLGLEKLMAINVPMPQLTVQQTFDRLHAEVTALKVKHAAIREANAALLPATLERVFAGGH
ncbi:MAG: hypothetical protein JSR74_00450 [Proteobacteria bacterium]|nr:hypothetical protein [Pseudomonadota bacterium]MBS0595941.1 hypothetical protein [Pseudomonadota bacterium]